MSAGNRWCCERLEYATNSEELPVVYNAAFRTWGIEYRSGYGGGKLLLDYCPWCGERLPSRLTDVWFDRMDSMGIDADLSMDNPAIPDEMRDERWWRSEGL